MLKNVIAEKKYTEIVLKNVNLFYKTKDLLKTDITIIYFLYNLCNLNFDTIKRKNKTL